MDNKQQNGNSQLNQSRNDFNTKVSRLTMLGQTKKVKWSNRRRWRNV